MDPARQQVQTRRPWRWIVYLAAGLLFLGWLLNTPPGIFGKADAVGYAVCHRISSRSFFLGDRQMPLCARCSGMFLGAMLGILYQGVAGRRRTGMPPWPVAAALALFVMAFAIDGINSYLHLFPTAPHYYEPHNWLRLVTGSGMGLAVSAALFPAFNQTVWVEADRRPAIDSLRSLGVLLVLAAGLVGLVLTENPLILYPLALISAGSVLVLLVTVYTMVSVMVLRMENRYFRLSHMALPLTGGFLIALFQIAALDLARFWLTGTWQGFQLG